MQQILFDFFNTISRNQKFNFIVPKNQENRSCFYLIGDKT